MTVRDATPADAPAVARMLHDFNAEFGEETPGVEVLTERLGALLARDEVAAVVAGEEDGLALLTFRPGIWDEGPVALLEELYVRPQLRGRGIGGELIERAFALARERGSQTFQVNVDESDVDAQRFYEAHGVSVRQPGSGERAFYFEKRL
ncbi:MAG TPA: GNAT family N-acetyltransferase [Solirubrobacteraceae bacterium]|nr:GNAT family N-acetyltransferase [Solirubrobacteraceae bacterium]